jgi:hypothetical protein
LFGSISPFGGGSCPPPINRIPKKKAFATKIAQILKIILSKKRKPHNKAEETAEIFFRFCDNPRPFPY